MVLTKLYEIKRQKHPQNHESGPGKPVSNPPQRNRPGIGMARTPKGSSKKDQRRRCDPRLSNLELVLNNKRANKSMSEAARPF